MEHNIYTDIATRTGGNIYIGVVGPVRTGKSSFIKSFMESMVLPNIEDVYVKERARDEIPQSGSGKTIMTAEPKFVPEEAVKITIDGKSSFNVRLIDSVGYMVPGAAGQFEDSAPRMVTTPWSEHEMTMAEAAELGTRKVICDHSTIGLLVTTDGSIGEIPRADYEDAEERIVKELKDINKPFCILVNSADPGGKNASALKDRLSEKYGVPCLLTNCMTLDTPEIERILSTILYQFPVKEYIFTLPDWLMYLPEDNTFRKDLYSKIYASCEDMSRMQDAVPVIGGLTDEEAVCGAEVCEINLGDGSVYSKIDVPQSIFYKMLSEYSGITVENEGSLMECMCRLSKISAEYDKISGALEQVRRTGYGIVMPEPAEIQFEEPEIVKQGGRFGVRLKANAPSIHIL